MTERRFSVTPYRVVLFIATVFTITSIIFLVDSNLFSQRREFQESDYIMTFYVAGHLIVSGKASDLYPAAEATSFIDASFDKAAHTLLDSLPENTTAIYMYSPVVAWLFAPLSHLSPNLSLLAWQALSIVALTISCKLIAQSLEINFGESLFFCSLFGPIFITLWSGQLGLVLGLLPLSIGYILFLRGFPFVAGLIWSLLLLKPQYFPAVGFVALVVAICGNFRIALGIFFGTLGIVGANLLLFSPALVIQWLISHRLSDTIFTQAQYGIPTHLITSLPADLLLLLPPDIRSAMKWPAYFVSMLFWMVGVYVCRRFYGGPWETRTKFSLTVAIGCILSSIALPHLLYYDLCVLIPAGFMLATKNNVVPKTMAPRTIAVVAWVGISFYLPAFLFFTRHVGVALLLEIIILICLIWLVMQINRAINSPNAV
jgi:hypothetical protein